MSQTILPGAPKGHPPALSQPFSKMDSDNQKGKPTSNPRITCSSDTEGVHLSQKEIESLPGHEIRSTESGLHYLELMLLTVPGIPCTTEALVMTLFQVSMFPGVRNSCPSINAIRAVAYILADNEVEAISSSLVDAVTLKVDSHMAVLREEAMVAAATIHNSLAEAAASLKSQLEGTAVKTLENTGQCRGSMTQLSNCLRLPQNIVTLSFVPLPRWVPSMPPICLTSLPGLKQGRG